MNIDPQKQRPQMDEGLGIILRLLTEEEPITYQGSWFELKNAQLQLRPYQRPHMPVAVASTISPKGMTTAAKHGVGVLSIASYSGEGLQALPNQWSFAEKAAAEAGRPAPSRASWRVVLPIHLAESREEAFRDVDPGLLHWNNEYFHGTLKHPAFKEASDAQELAQQMTQFGAPVIGTPDDLVARIHQLQEVSGGFGTVLLLAHEWCDRQKTMKSYELLARYVMPRFQDLTSWIDRSGAWTRDNSAALNAGAGAAIIKAITDNKDAAAMMQQAAAQAGPGEFIEPGKQAAPKQ